MIYKLVATTLVAFFIVLFAGAVTWEISISLEDHARTSKVQDAKNDLYIARLNAKKRALELKYRDCLKGRTNKKIEKICKVR